MRLKPEVEALEERCRLCEGEAAAVCRRWLSAQNLEMTDAAAAAAALAAAGHQQQKQHMQQHYMARTAELA